MKTRTRKALKDELAGRFRPVPYSELVRIWRKLHKTYRINWAEAFRIKRYCTENNLEIPDIMKIIKVKQWLKLQKNM